jgi:hypothetical protein
MASAVVAVCAPDTVPLIGGETLWINVAQGQSCDPWMAGRGREICRIPRRLRW